MMIQFQIIIEILLLSFSPSLSLYFQESSSYPKHDFAFMGLMDGLSSLMCIIGGAFTSGPAQLTLAQFGIPVSLILASVILKQRYVCINSLIIIE